MSESVSFLVVVDREEIQLSKAGVGNLFGVESHEHHIFLNVIS